jgi:hypothetical protein
VAVGLPGGGLGGGGLGGQVATLVALGQDLDREVRAIALAQPAADAVGRLDDRVVRQQEAVFGADFDADVAALAPLVDPPDVDVVDDGRGAVDALLGGIRRSRGSSPDSVKCPRVRERDTKSTESND